MNLRDAKILVTGASGFIGVNLVQALSRDDGATVFGASRDPYRSWRLEGLKDVHLVSLDILDRKNVDQVLKSSRPDFIVHCATYGMYFGREKDKLKTLRTSVEGFLNILIGAAENGVKGVMNSGTTSEYGRKDTPMSEDMLLEPDNTYGVAKAAASLLGAQLGDEFGLPVLTLRLFSPYGPYEARTRLIPSLILSYLRGEAPRLSSGLPVRDFTFVGDIVGAYRKALELLGRKRCGIFNIGNGKQYSISEAAEKVRCLVGSDLRPEWGSVATVQKEPPLWVADREKAKIELGWEPRYTFEDGLKESIQWFKNNIKLYD